MVVHDGFLRAEKPANRGEQPALPFAEQLRYWRKQLEGVRTSELPVERSRSTNSTSTSSTSTTVHTFDVPRDVAARAANLKDLCGVPLFELAVATFQVVLARYTGRDDIAVVTLAPGSNHPVVLRSWLADSVSFLDFVLKVRDTVKAAFAHSEVPFERLAEELGLEPGLARVMVVSERPTVPLDVDLAVLFEWGDELSGVVEYRRGLFDPATIERLAGHLTTVLDIVTADPDVPLTEIDILSEDVRARLLVEWNDTDRDVQPATFPQLFEAQVARTPDLPAVVFDSSTGRRDEQVLGGALSYVELEARANQLAHLLIKLGARPERIVALALPRSV